MDPLQAEGDRDVDIRLDIIDKQYFPRIDRSPGDRD